MLAAVGLVAISYPTVRDNSALDKTFQGLPPSVQALLGLDPANALTSPVGYLDSQFYANLLPIILLVFSIGLGSWAIRRRPSQERQGGRQDAGPAVAS